MRRSVVAISSLVLIFSSLGISPANAVPVEVLCTSGSFTVDANVVTTNTACAGIAVIPEGVTSVGYGAFSSNTTLAEVSLSSSVVSIEMYAFAYTSSLTKFEFAVSALPATIGERAFEESGLKSFIVPARVTSIGNHAFRFASDLTSFEFESSSNLTSIGEFAFAQVPISSIALPSSLTVIGPNVFSAAYIDYVEIPSSVTSIDANAFGAVGAIDVYFLGSAPTVVHENAFINSYGHVFTSTPIYLQSFVPNQASTWKGLYPTGVFYTANFDSNGGTTVRHGAFGVGTGEYAGLIWDVGVAPKSPTKSGAIFAGWSATNGGEKVTFPYLPEAPGDITFYALWALPFDSATGSGYLDCSISGTFTVVDNVVKISDSCLGTAAIPDSVTEIFSDAFYGSRLTSASFTSESKLKFIGDSAFENASLENIIIPSSVTSIEYSAFRETNNLISVTFAPDSKLKVIGQSAFSDATALRSITIPANVTHIWSDAFYDNYDLASVTFAAGSKLTYIGESAFNYAESLEAIEIPASVTSIDNSAFEDANELASITFAPGSKLSYLGSYAFASTAITSIQIPAGVHFLRNHLFQSANYLEDIYFLGDAPSVTTNLFANFGSNSKAFIKSTATGFPAVDSLWKGLTVTIGVYDAEFVSNGGSAVASDSFVSGGAIADPAAPTRTGYTFADWSTTDGASAITFPYTPVVTRNITLFAKWTLGAVSAAAPVSQGSSAPTAIDTVKNLSKSIAFLANSKSLTKANKAAIKRSVIASGKDANYVVTGTAGLLPGLTVAQAKKLATLRANSIKAYLVVLGVNKSNISIKVEITNQGIVPKTKILASYVTS